MHWVGRWPWVSRRLAVRGGEVFVPRLGRAGASPAESVVSIDPHGTVLITGGTGVLGGLLARYLVCEHGVDHLLLASRRGGEAQGAAELRAELELLGAKVTIAACDVADREALRGLLGSVPEEFPLRGVVHAAGVIDDCVIGSLTAERLDGVFASKVDAAWSLHELTEHLDLSIFVLFSSAAGTLGSPGQGSYAAANAFLDALAAHRRTRGLTSVSMAWGFWEEASGLTGGLSETDRSRMKRSGMGALSSQEGLELFDASLNAGEALMLPAPLDLAVLRTQARAGVLPTIFAGLVQMPARRASDAGRSLARRLAGVSEAEREAVVLDMVRGEVAAVLGFASPAAIDIHRAFKDLGFDSLAAVELRNRLNTTTGLRLPATLVFDHPTTVALAGYLGKHFEGDQEIRGAVDVEFDRLENLLASIASESEMQGRLKLRWRAFNSRMQRLLTNGSSSDMLDEPDVGTDEDLGTDDDVFAFLDEWSGGLVDHTTESKTT